MPGRPPPDVEAAAVIVNGWLERETAQPKSTEELAKLSAAERLDRCRQFDQSKMPAWRDPRS